MNVWNGSKRKWALESELKPKIKENNCIIKIYSNKRLIILTPKEANRLFSSRQSVQFIYNK